MKYFGTLAIGMILLFMYAYFYNSTIALMAYPGAHQPFAPPNTLTLSLSPGHHPPKNMAV
jgi:hypothetical protein